MVRNCFRRYLTSQAWGECECKINCHMINITGCFSVTLTSFFSISDRGKIEIVQDDDAEDVALWITKSSISLHITLSSSIIIKINTITLRVCINQWEPRRSEADLSEDDEMSVFQCWRLEPVSHCLGPPAQLVLRPPPAPTITRLSVKLIPCWDKFYYYYIWSLYYNFHELLGKQFICNTLCIR